MNWRACEKLASRILQSEGWQIIHQNTFGPFDVVAQKGNFTKFVQVKLRNGIRTKRLAQKVASGVLETFRGREKLPEDVRVEVWLFYSEGGNWKVVVV